jgi:hypothetical protein
MMPTLPSTDRPELPLVARAGALREAAGLGPGRRGEIDAPALGVIIEPHELDAYLSLLTEPATITE